MTHPLLQARPFPPFSEVHPEQVPEALGTLLAEGRELIERLSGTRPATWSELGQVIEDFADRMNRFWSPVSHLNAVMNSAGLREAYNACVGELSRFSTEMGQNRGLYEAWKTLHDSPAFSKLGPDYQQTIRNALRDFHLAGVDLPEAEKAEFARLSEKLAQLTSRFSDNVLDATQAWTRHVEDEQALSGLPESALTGAREAARAKGLDGWLLTLEFPCYYAVMTYCDNRALRRDMYEAYVTRASDLGPHAGKWDNTPLIHEIMQARQARARLLGFANHAEYSLATKMAKTPEEVLAFLNELAEKSVPVARREFAELEAFVAESGGPEDGLQPWDVSYYSEKLRQQRYDLSQEALRPWFPVDRVVDGMFRVAGRLFDIQVAPAPCPDSYHPDVRFYEIRRGEQVLAYLYMDLFARSNKRGGAWMSDYASRRRRADGSYDTPVAFITSNFTPPSDNRPALLTHNEVTTLFHEFGHALHHMLSRVDSYEVSGINGVPWDAVELPSQFMENWCWEPEALAYVSAHYETGEPLPEDMLNKLLAARNFQSGMMMVRQLEFALFDFRLHVEYDGPDYDVRALMEDVRRQVCVVPVAPFNRFENSFSHIFAGGYAAGYYSYKWAEVLSADAFSRFEEEGIFSEAAGRDFRRFILEKGGSADPMDLFVAFRGRKPSVAPLLRHSGILTETQS